MANQNDIVFGNEQRYEAARATRELCYELGFLSKEVMKLQNDLDESRKTNHSQSIEVETLKTQNAELKSTLKYANKRLSNLSNIKLDPNLAAIKEKLELVTLENKALKDMQHQFQKDRYDMEQTIQQLNKNHYMDSINNIDLISERNVLMAKVESLSKSIVIQAQDKKDFEVMKNGLENAKIRVKDAAYYMDQIKLIRNENLKQTKEIAYYKSHSEQLEVVINEMKEKQKRSISTAACENEPFYQTCTEKLDNIINKFAVKLEEEQKANVVFIELDSLTRNKYKIVKQQLQEIRDKTFIDAEIQTEIITDENI